MDWMRCVLLCLLAVSSAAAQSTTAVLRGTISDSSGAVVQGARISATNTDTNLTGSVVSDDSGNYTISGLPPGMYRIEASFGQLQKQVRSGVRLQVNESRRIDLILQVGPAEQSVEVTAAAPLLQTDDSSVGKVIGENDIRDLPLNGRTYESLVQLAPTVVLPAPGSHLSSRGGFNVSGMDEHSNSFFLDGVDNVDPVIRNFSFRPSLDLIQEFKIETSGHKAEFGRNAGGVINVVTKSGTNVMHGSLWEFFRNDNLDARNFFALSDAAKPPLIRNQFGAALGGPLRKGKTFFFGSYEGLRFKAGSVRRATVPTAAMRRGDLSEYGVAIHDLNGNLFDNGIIPDSRIDPLAREVIQAFPLPNRPGLKGNRVETANRIENGNDFSLRIDHSLTDQTNIMGRFSSGITRILDPFRSETGISTNLAGFGQTADRLRTNFVLGVTTRIGGNLVNEFRAGYDRFNQPLIPLNPGTPGQVPFMSLEKAFLTFVISSFDPLGSGQEFRREVNVYNYLDSVSFSLGSHQVKTGVDARRYLSNFDAKAPNGFTFSGTRVGREPAIKDFLLGLPFSATSFTGSSTGNARKFEFASYIQDDWKVTSRLTLNYGLRWEFYGRIGERVNKQSIWLASCNCMGIAGKDVGDKLVDNDLNNFAPRFGFALRPFKNSTVIRASAGIFYDNDMRTNAEVIGPPFFYPQVFSSQSISSLSLSNPFPTNLGVASLSPATLDTHYRDTYVEQWNLNVQQEIKPGLMAEVGYVGNHMVKARRQRNLNQIINGVRPYSGFASITLFEEAGSSTYNALEARLEGRVTRGLRFTSTYTWGHAIDDRPSTKVQDNTNMHAERADSDFDVRHRWTVNGVYNIPSSYAQSYGRFARSILSGWSFSGISMFQGGRPFSVMIPQDISGAGNGPAPANRPNLVSGVNWRPTNQGPDSWINPMAFSIPVTGTFGSAGRNVLRGPKYYNLDLALLKDAHPTERVTMQFRAEFFNILNHPNFAPPNALFDASSPTGGSTFGVISSTISPERQIQLGLRVGF